MSSDQLVRTRIAPSPTGEIHIGTLRTLIYNYAFARQHHGKFVLRVEDTDQKRYVPGSEKRLLQDIKAYGLSWDEGPDIGGPYAPYVQTDRLAIYRQYIQKLLDLGGAYYCFCSPQRLEEMRSLQKAAHQLPRYDRRCLSLTPAQIQENLAKKLPYVIRLKMPDREVLAFTDLVRGEIRFNTADVDDQVLIKSNGIPTYHFAAGIDDHLMEITHVLRAEEWISSVPKQLILYRYFGWTLPQMAHLTVFLDPSGRGKMSKRRGSVSARGFLDDGYLPQAVLNYLMLLGWNPGTNQEIFSLEEFIQAFDLKHLHKQQPIFDRKKLDYFNGFYIRKLSDDALVDNLVPFFPPGTPLAIIAALAPLIKERITTLKDAYGLSRYLLEEVDYPADSLLAKGASQQLACQFLTKSIETLTPLSSWEVPAIQLALLDLIKSNSWNTGQFFMVFRIAIAGSPITPPIVDTLPILGQAKTIDRLQSALTKLASLC